MKAEHLAEAERIFDGSGVRVTCTSKRHFGAALRSGAFIKEYVRVKVVTWTAELGKLASIAKSEPHAAFAAFTNGPLDVFSCEPLKGLHHCFSHLRTPFAGTSF